jgi:hypothetical protein
MDQGSQPRASSKRVKKKKASMRGFARPGLHAGF